MLSTTQEAGEYRKKFHQYYYNRIIPGLERYELARKAQLGVFTFWSVMIVVAVLGGIYAFNYYSQILPHEVFYGNPNVNRDHGVSELVVDATMGLCVLFWWIAFKVKKNFERKVKEGVIHSFLSFFGDFVWSPKESLGKEEIEASRLTGNITTIKPDDYFEGTHNGIKFVISEVKLIRGNGKNSSKVFEGIFIKLDMNKRIQGHTIILEPAKWYSVSSSPTPPAGIAFHGLDKVELEDVEFNKMFHVYSTDQTESRYILTTAFMERFKHLREIYKAKDIRASFQDNSILIGLNCDKDMFVLGDVLRPVTDTQEMQTLFEQFVAILSIVELLNLDSKTGL